MARRGKKFVWHGRKFRNRIEAYMHTRLEAVGALLEGDIKESFGESPAPAGGPPGVDTGRLRASIANERKGMTLRVGTNVEYGPHQELGTSKMDARPFLRPAIPRNKSTIKSYFRKKAL